jgi:SAM-dependent methyltransferase
MGTTTATPAGTAAVQGKLWSARADDWAAIQEGQLAPAYHAALDALEIGPGMRLLDVGCGAGMVLALAAERGVEVAGLDASPGLLTHARRRVPDAQLSTGEMEQLPYEDASFCVVTGFNSFQYAARPVLALSEARRVVRSKGRVLMLNWAPPEQCQAAGHLKAIGRLLPAPPPGAPGPFALSNEDALRTLFDEAGLEIARIEDVPCVLRYADEPTAIAGLISPGPVVRAIEHAGEDAVRAATIAFLEPFRADDGSYAINNVFRYVIGTPRS